MPSRMAKTGGNREVAAAVVAADFGWWWQQQSWMAAAAAAEEVDRSRGKRVNWSRGEGFGSISIYIESNPVPT